MGRGAPNTAGTGEGQLNHGWARPGSGSSRPSPMGWMESKGKRAQKTRRQCSRVRDGQGKEMTFVTLLSSGVPREGPWARQPAGSTGSNQQNGDQNLRNGSFWVHKQPSLRPPCREGGGATWGQEGPSGPRGQPGARHAPALIGTRRPAAGVLPVEPVPTKIHLGGRRRAGSFPQAPSRCQQRTGAASDPDRPQSGVSIRGTAASRCPKSSRASVRSASRSGARRGEGPRGREGTP